MKIFWLVTKIRVFTDNMSRKKLIRISTVPTSLNTFLRGQLEMLSFHFEVVAVSSPDSEL